MTSLRTQLLGAIAAGLALGCKSETTHTAHPVPPDEGLGLELHARIAAEDVSDA